MYTLLHDPSVCVYLIHKIGNKLCVNKIGNTFELLHFDVH